MRPTQPGHPLADPELYKFLRRSAYKRTRGLCARGLLVDYEDVVQTAYKWALTNLPSYDPEKGMSFATWMHLLLRRAINWEIGKLLYQKKRIAYSLDGPVATTRHEPRPLWSTGYAVVAPRQENILYAGEVIQIASKLRGKARRSKEMQHKVLPLAAMGYGVTELGAHFGISKQRIEQIEKANRKALVKRVA